MKRKLLFIFILGLLVFGLLIWHILASQKSDSPSVGQSVSPTLTPLKTRQQSKIIQLDTETYSYALIGPIAPTRIKLISNLPNKDSSSTLKSTHQCSTLTSGGFYTKENTHIGLFLVDDVVVSEQSSNSLFHAYLWKTSKNAIGIGQLLPDDSMSFALQTGPLLISNSETANLRLRTDEPARRIAVGLTTDQEFIFYSVFDEEDSFSGPTLESLPNIIAAIIRQEQQQVTDVVNLDGGSHSTFQNDAVSLYELSPVGSIFCIK